MCSHPLTFSGFPQPASRSALSLALSPGPASQPVPISTIAIPCFGAPGRSPSPASPPPALVSKALKKRNAGQMITNSSVPASTLSECGIFDTRLPLLSGSASRLGASLVLLHRVWVFRGFLGLCSREVGMGFFGRLGERRYG